LAGSILAIYFTMFMRVSSSTTIASSDYILNYVIIFIE